MLRGLCVYSLVLAIVCSSSILVAEESKMITIQVPLDSRCVQSGDFATGKQSKMIVINKSGTKITINIEGCAVQAAAGDLQLDNSDADDQRGHGVEATEISNELNERNELDGNEDQAQSINKDDLAPSNGAEGSEQDPDWMPSVADARAQRDGRIPTGSLIAGGTGVATLLMGLGFGVHANNLASGAPNIASPEFIAAERNARIANVFLITSGLALATGTVIYLIDKSKRTPAAIEIQKEEEYITSLPNGVVAQKQWDGSEAIVMRPMPLYSPYQQGQFN